MIGRKPARSARCEQSGNAREHAACREVEGDKKLTAKVGQPIALSAIVTDDGVRRRREGGAGLVRQADRQDGEARRSRGTRRTRRRPASGRSRQSGRSVCRPEPQSSLQPAVAHHRRQGQRPPLRVVRLSREREASFDPPQVKTWEETRAGGNSPWAPCGSHRLCRPITGGPRR